jgi:hypothetical protein
MILRTQNNKRKWQRKFIKMIFDYSGDKKKYFTKIALENPNLLNEKNEKLPKYLFKYYPPTSENILDIKNQRLWLSHPKSFNDPFDCNIGYDKEKFEKDMLLRFISMNRCVEEQNKLNSFTLEESWKIEDSHLGFGSYLSRREYFSDVKELILKSKSKELQETTYDYLKKKETELDLKISKLRDIDIRVACFSEFDKYDEFFKQVVMWSHYAENHKGFCVEYDLEFLKNDIQFSLTDYEFYSEKGKYLKERNEVVIKTGLFPIEYTCNRINIPVTKLNKIDVDISGKINYNNIIDELIYKTFIVKSANWSYEKEWRLIVNDKICDFYDNKIPFPYIKTIYLGCKAEKGLIDTMMAIGEEIGKEVILLKMDSQKFILERSSTYHYKYMNEMKQQKNPFN